MAPLLILISATLILRGIGAFGVAIIRDWPSAMRVGLMIMFCFTAVAHFNHLRADLIRMVPPYLPAPDLLVTMTGIFEIIGGIALLFRETRLFAAYACILLLLALLPANIYAATHGLTLGGAPVTSLYPRIIIQLLFIFSVYYAGIRIPVGDESQTDQF